MPRAPKTRGFRFMLSLLLLDIQAKNCRDLIISIQSGRTILLSKIIVKNTLVFLIKKTTFEKWPFVFTLLQRQQPRLYAVTDIYEETDTYLIGGVRLFLCKFTKLMYQKSNEILIEGWSFIWYNK